MADPFMLVSLKDKEAKKLSKVIGSQSCRKILEYLTGKDATESQIAKDLKMPLSTVHHNLQQLVEAKLVVTEEFHYSPKGREVNHYKLANKYIIIAPQEPNDSFFQHLKQFLPVTLLTLGTAAVLKTLQLLPERSREVSMLAMEDMAESAMMAKAAEPLEVVSVPWWLSPMVDWAILGAFAAIALFVLLEWFRWKRKH